MKEKISKDRIETLRASSRKLLREWGILHLEHRSKSEDTPSFGHALLEIMRDHLTITDLSKRLLLSVSTTSRMVNELLDSGLITVEVGDDLRTKHLALTDKGVQKCHEIDDYSTRLINNAFRHLNEEQVDKIIDGITMYANALDASRNELSDVKIYTLSKDVKLRKEITQMVSSIQKDEFGVNIHEDTNLSILKAEDYYRFGNKMNFWYAKAGDEVIGCIGLRLVNGADAELKKCFVAKPYRGIGLAQQLVNKLLVRASKAGLENIYLGTVSHFTWAHKFYQKFGFVKVEQSVLPKEFEADPHDSVFFRLSLQQSKG